MLDYNKLTRQELLERIAETKEDLAEAIKKANVYRNYVMEEIGYTHDLEELNAILEKKDEEETK